VIHCHQYFSLPTFVAALFGRLRGSRVFVTDLGGGGWTPGYQVDPSRWIVAHLPLSEYAARGLRGRNRRHQVIWGGVALERYPMRAEPVHDGSAVFLGRLLPHKGIHFLIEGLPPEVPLQVVGPCGDPAYLERLRELARGKDVTFHGALEDGKVIGILGRAMALVHPTPVDAAGSAGVNELFGLALVEAMARGCPVIASNAASLPEIVTPEVNGLLVLPNRPEALSEAVLRLRRDPDLWARLSAGARRTVEERFTWERVVDRCLEAYRG
jgi:glycosyltransferase involved in cell wall biosynthesis